MPPRKALPEGFIERSSDSKVRCQTCKGDWMNRTSVTAHVKSKTHVESRQVVAAGIKANKAAERFYEDAAQDDLQHFALPEPAPRPAIEAANNPFPLATNPLSSFELLVPDYEPSAEELAHAQSVLDSARERTIEEFERRYAAVMQTLTQDLRALRLSTAAEDEDEDDATISAISRDLRQQGESLRSATAAS